jgi:hypothetical protein
MRRVLLIAAALCAFATVANAQSMDMNKLLFLDQQQHRQEAPGHRIPVFNAPIGLPSPSVAMPNPMKSAYAVQQQTQNQMLQLQQQGRENTRQMEQSGQAIGEGLEHLAHACDPDVLRRPGLHLLSRMGLCGERRAEAPAQERVAAQPREVPPMHNGPMSVYDRPYPYYHGH